MSQTPFRGLTAVNVLVTQLARNPEAPFISEVTGVGIERTLTYRQFDAYSRGAMTWLHQELNLEPSDVLAIAPRNDLASVVTMFGALRLGAALAIVSAEDPPARQMAISDALDTRSLLTTPPVLESLPRGETPDAVLDPAADAFYFGTSGSTATSKIVAQTHRGATANALAMQQHHAIGPGHRFLGCLPIHHVNGFHFTFLHTLYCGAHAVLLDGFDPFKYPEVLEHVRPHIASVVPSILQSLLVTWRSPRIPNDFRYFVSAAAPLKRQTACSVWERWGVRVMQGYGLTEANNFSTMLPRALSNESYRRYILEPDIPSIGCAVQGNEIAILDSDGRVLRPGCEGEICIRGYNIMDRYVGNPAATDKAFEHGWFHSGDLGLTITDAGTNQGLFVITGRKKNIAKVGGESVSLEEIERVLSEIPGITDAACTTIEDRIRGESIVALLEADTGVTDAQVFEHLRRNFAESALPSKLLRQSIPRSVTGKILRTRLRECVQSIV